MANLIKSSIFSVILMRRLVKKSRYLQKCHPSVGRATRTGGADLITATSTQNRYLTISSLPTSLLYYHQQQHNGRVLQAISLSIPCQCTHASLLRQLSQSINQVLPSVTVNLGRLIRTNSFGSPSATIFRSKSDVEALH
jgi:hypothetical protein